ncbi:glutamine--fructose-6-phosphate transaminase (isomerizing) [Bremerella cremea]|uniref:Glutamine--fructose-6-phosphate aminotransferase [isomerizing] n=1 Tax=Blastopirellula marina TaxID=124 RepID=A0A2S8FFF2_9BACT|nr:MULTISPECIES: glutamine--fructose-6-phosphate transaminase (isomerizing) [Pirellulaceae]PQO30903.1 glutamine--fructose-6-phosphate transaminase (isomerizing) [Blastopirellula marina]RCS44050.1 glutamine--fructose-6-phosphate transaminase (isomerizing) [Bremerella cremea]
MCGIVGYVGNSRAADFLLEGLRRLEYRGYDSAGIAAMDNYDDIHIVKSAGRIAALADQLALEMPIGSTGIGHTRWATHGPATQANAHPHAGPSGEVVVVHNGVIENYAALKTRLQQKGYIFRSDTDTEVIAYMLEDALKQLPIGSCQAPSDEELVALVQTVLAKLQGTYGVGILFRSRPDLIIAARLGSPLVIGVSEDAHYLASDASPLVGYTEKIVYLTDHQIALLKADSLQIAHRDLGEVAHSVEKLEIASGDVELGEFEHYMLKEIFEQPQSLENAMRGRLSLDNATAVFGGLNLSPQELRSVDRILLTACGTSWHAAMVGEYMIEEMARIPVEVEYASELRYRNPPVPQRTLVFGITQSGETADTLAALREMKRKGHPTLAICNVVGSSIAQEADGGIYLHAGPEVGVASTKAFTSQLAIMAMLGLYFGRLNHLSFDQGYRMIQALQALPDAVRQALNTREQAKKVAEKYQAVNNFLYLGRYFNFPVALEGALKLKEISYIHAEGYPAAELKHGPIALVDENTPSVFIMPQGVVYDKVMSNLQEIKARGGPVIAIANEDDHEIEKYADDVIRIPKVEEFLQPIVSVIPLQFIAYHIALLRGCDVDKPRNLAKSVTVE